MTRSELLGVARRVVVPLDAVEEAYEASRRLGREMTPDQLETFIMNCRICNMTPIYVVRALLGEGP